jgi:hypothetical protein
LSLIPFWRAGPALVLECYGIRDQLGDWLSTK